MQDKLYDIWTDRFEIFRKPKALNSKTCGNCEHLNECDGGGAHTWDYSINEPRLCMLDMIKIAKATDHR